MRHYVTVSAYTQTLNSSPQVLRYAAADVDGSGNYDDDFETTDFSPRSDGGEASTAMTRTGCPAT